MRKYRATYKLVHNKDSSTTYTSKPFNTYKEARDDLIEELKRLDNAEIDSSTLEYHYVVVEEIPIDKNHKLF